MARIFLTDLSRYVSYALIEQLRNDHTDEPHNVIVGAAKPGYACPPGVSTLVSKSKSRPYRRYLLESDLIIIDLVNGDLEEAEAILKILAEAPPRDRVVICISTPLSWAGEVSGEGWRTREVTPRYEGLKELETLGLTMNASGVKVYVLVPGILFGNGEETFKYHLETAWLEDPRYLAVIGSGLNIVPTLHVRDFALSIETIFREKPEQRYLVCSGSSISQLELVSAISSLGTGAVRHIDLLEVLEEDWTETISVDASLATSSCFESMNWHCRSILSGLELVRAEFNLFRGLRQVKLFVTGPPASGKTSLAKQLSRRLNLPHVHVLEVVEAVTRLDSELGAEIRAKLEELKTAMIADAEKHKKKNQELDYAKFNPRIPDDLLAKAFHWRLSLPQVMNRGFVLDGWPRNYNDAMRFKETPVWVENVKPDKVVLLAGPNDVLIARVKELGPEKTAGTHYTDEGMKKRLAQYKEFTSEKLKTLKDFYRDEHLQVIEVDLALPTSAGVERVIEALTVTPVQENTDRTEASVRLESRAKFIDDIGEVEHKAGLSTLVQDEQIKMRERESLENKSQPMRFYLLENVLPQLTSALLKVCEAQPQDQLQYLVDTLVAIQRETQVAVEAEAQD